MATLRDKGNVSLYLSDLRTVSRFQTSHHDGAIYLHPQLGKVLALNGEIQHVEVWAPLYHEPLVHLPAAFLREPRTALVLGGSSFFAVQELLRYQTIRRVLMLELDQRLVDTVIKNYNHAKRVQRDLRLEIRICNAFNELPRLTEQFDLVINDAVDLMCDNGSAVKAMTRVLGRRGVCSDVVYRHIFEDRSLTKTIRLLRDSYHNAVSLIFAAEYPGILHLLTMWSASTKLSQTARSSVNEEQLLWKKSPSSNPCSYFDPKFLQYYLHVPPLVRRRLT